MREELDSLREALRRLRAEDKVLIAVLYGSFSGGAPHVRSDIASRGDAWIETICANGVNPRPILSPLVGQTRRQVTRPKKRQGVAAGHWALTVRPVAHARRAPMYSARVLERGLVCAHSSSRISVLSGRSPARAV
jgi:hypothetical protein